MLEIVGIAACVLAFVGYQLIGRIAGSILYVTLSVDKVSIRNIRKSEEASMTATEDSMRFSHPRALVGNFTNAEVLLKNLTKKMGGFTAPSVVVHPLENVDGGLTQIEERCLRELVIGGTNARMAVVYTGPRLTDSEVIQKVKGG